MRKKITCKKLQKLENLLYEDDNIVAFFSYITILTPETIAKKKGRKKRAFESDADEMSEHEDNSDIKNGLSFMTVQKTPETVLVDFENFISRKFLISGFDVQKRKNP